ncbi:MAG: hypothetical protein Q8N57_03965 [bacterium]|nr:hypothetical protein [bacterium]
MRKMLFFLMVIATITMLSIVGCEKQPAGSDDPNNPNNAPVLFTLSSTIGVTLPASYTVDSYYILVKVTVDGVDQIFHMTPPGTTRTFKGDTARLWLNKDMQIRLVFNVHGANGGPYINFQYTPSDVYGNGIFGKVAATNTYSFVITKVQGVNM